MLFNSVKFTSIRGVFKYFLYISLVSSTGSIIIVSSVSFCSFISIFSLISFTMFSFFVFFRPAPLTGLDYGVILFLVIRGLLPLKSLESFDT